MTQTKPRHRLPAGRPQARSPSRGPRIAPRSCVIPCRRSTLEFRRRFGRDIRSQQRLKRQTCPTTFDSSALMTRVGIRVNPGNDPRKCDERMNPGAIGQFNVATPTALLSQWRLAIAAQPARLPRADAHPPRDSRRRRCWRRKRCPSLRRYQRYVSTPRAGLRSAFPASR